MARTDDVIAAIRGMIQHGELRAGSRLPTEADLAARLDVSRSSLREGVRSLIAMGLLEARQGAGTYVTSLDMARLFAPMEFIADLEQHDALEFLQVRRVLECEAASLAARRIDEESLREAELWVDRTESLMDGEVVVDHELFVQHDLKFHEVIAEASGNATLAALLRVFAGRTSRTRASRSETHREAGTIAVREHRALLEALRAGDPERARVVMHVHLLGVEDFVNDHAMPHHAHYPPHPLPTTGQRS